MLQWCTITYTELNYLLNSNLKYKTTATCFSWMSNEMFQKEKETELYFELNILCSINRTDQYNFWGCSWEMFKIFSIITQVKLKILKFIVSKTGWQFHFFHLFRSHESFQGHRKIHHVKISPHTHNCFYAFPIPRSSTRGNRKENKF